MQGGSKNITQQFITSNFNERVVYMSDFNIQRSSCFKHFQESSLAHLTLVSFILFIPRQLHGPNPISRVESATACIMFSPKGTATTTAGQRYCQNFMIINSCHILAHFSQPKAPRGRNNAYQPLLTYINGTHMNTFCGVY